MSLKTFPSKPCSSTWRAAGRLRSWQVSTDRTLFRSTSTQRIHPLILALSSLRCLIHLSTLACRNYRLSCPQHPGMMHRGQAAALPPSPGTVSGARLPSWAGAWGWPWGKALRRRKARKYRETETKVLSSFSPHTRTWSFGFWAKSLFFHFLSFPSWVPILWALPGWGDHCHINIHRGDPEESSFIFQNYYS